MNLPILIAALLVSVSTNATAGIVDGPELRSMREFQDGKFQFQSVKNTTWFQISQDGGAAVAREGKVWVPAVLYMPARVMGKVPAMVIIHGSGGLYRRDGKRRPYWDYAEELAKNGVAAVIVDSHGARGIGIDSTFAAPQVTVYPLIADAYAVADMLRTHPQIDAARIGVMGFSKGGMVSLLSIDKRFAKALARDGSDFNLHIPIYPGCQTFPENLQGDHAPVVMLLGGADHFAGISGCYEIEETLRGKGADVSVIVYPNATHGWDENIPYTKVADPGSEDCRFLLKDGGGIRAKTPTQPLIDTPDGKAYVNSCMKLGDNYIEHNDAATKKGRQAVVDAALKYLKGPGLGIPRSLSTPVGMSLEEQLGRLQGEQEEEMKQMGSLVK